MKFLKKKYQNDGFIKLRNFTSKDKKFQKISLNLNKELESAIKKTKLNKLGGYIIGNLNVYPGKYGFQILNILKKNGLNKIIKDITGKNLNSFDILFGGNLSLPYKFNQHFHTDGDFNDKMILINIATSDVSLNSGPTEIVLKSHQKNLKYWEFLFQKKKFKRLKLSFGDLLIRSHYLWHRGTINKSNKNRFLIAFLLFEKSRRMKQDQSKNSIKIYNNFFKNSLSGKLKEFIYVYLKLIFVIYKLIISLIRK